MTALERQMAADAIALSKEHAVRADAAEARWQELNDDLRGRIDADLAVAESFKDLDTMTSATHFALVSANRSTLGKMTELERAEVPAS